MKFKIFSNCFFFPKTRSILIQNMSNVFIKHESYSKLLPMDNFDYSHHRDVNLYVSEYLNVKMKSAQNR